MNPVTKTACAMGALAIAVTAGCLIRSGADIEPAETPAIQPLQAAGLPSDRPTDAVVASYQAGSDAEPRPSVREPLPIPAFLNKGIEWLVSAQHPEGGWGAGSNANQRNRNPHQVKTDPATTAFVVLALVRAGHTPVAGVHQAAVRKAVEHLVAVVAAAPADGPKITDLVGTQPQSKLGQLIDTPMTTQCLARVLNEIPADDPLRGKVDTALDVCLAKLEQSQQENGAWGGGGWAPVLQSSVGCNALELASAAGKSVDFAKLRSAREYQKGNVDKDSGRADARAAAGVEIYAFSSAQRAAAAENVAAVRLIEKAKQEGRLEPGEKVTVDSLMDVGVSRDQATGMFSAFAQSASQVDRLDDEKLIAGFGNNGGEEFLSYMMTSESLVVLGGENWDGWYDRMLGLFQKVQTEDGSWTGHHCITSPVFCTAAVVQCMTVDRDIELLEKISESTVAQAGK